jgi:hypothetical protein
MPAVDVYHKMSMDTLVAEDLKRVIRHVGVDMFSSQDGGITLGPEDFTILFHEAGPNDELTNDVIIRVQLHAFQNRLERTDAKAAQLAMYASTALDPLVASNDFTIGVSLLIAEIGWGTYFMPGAHGQY